MPDHGRSHHRSVRYIGTKNQECVHISRLSFGANCSVSHVQLDNASHATLTLRGSMLLGLSSVSFTPLLQNTIRRCRTPPRAIAIACSLVFQLWQCFLAADGEEVRMPSNGRSFSSGKVNGIGCCLEGALSVSPCPSERQAIACPCSFPVSVLITARSSPN